MTEWSSKYRILDQYSQSFTSRDESSYSNFYENVTSLRNLVKFCEFLSKSIMKRNAAA